MPSTPSRIAIMLPRFSRYGGVEQYAYRLAELLAQRGYKVDFLCARAETAAPEGVHVIAVGRGGGFRFIKMLWFLVAVEWVRKRNSYDCSVSFGKTWNQDITRVGGGPLRVFWKLSQQAWEPGLPRCGKQFMRWLNPASWLTFFIERRMFTRTPYIVAISQKVRSWLEEAYPHLQHSQQKTHPTVQIIYNCPDISCYYPPSHEQRIAARMQFNMGEEFALGVATTNFALKGVAPLIKTVALLPQEYRLHIAGGRNPEKYKALAESLGVGSRVVFHGRVQEMPAFYHAIDMFVLPTFYDTLANVVIEALASGVKTLCSNRAGAVEFLPSDQVIEDPADPAHMASKILDLRNKSDVSPFQPKGDGLQELIDLVERVLESKKKKIEEGISTS